MYLRKEINRISYMGSVNRFARIHKNLNILLRQSDPKDMNVLNNDDTFIFNVSLNNNSVSKLDQL